MVNKCKITWVFIKNKKQNKCISLIIGLRRKKNYINNITVKEKNKFSLLQNILALMHI